MIKGGGIGCASISSGGIQSIIGGANIEVSTVAGVATIDATYTAPFSDAIEETLTFKLGQYVTPQDFGAVGNGTTDDTSAFIKAIASGQRIFVPNGNYLITASLTLPNNLFMDFHGNAIILAGANNLTVFLVTTAAFSVKIFHARILGNGFTGVTGFDLTNCRINSRIFMPRIDNCTNGMILRAGTWDLVIDQPTIRNVTAPISASIFGGALKINHPAIDTFGAVGIDIFSSGANTTVGVQIIGGYVQAGTIGLRDAAYRTMVVGTYFENCTDVDVSLILNSHWFVAHDTQHLAAVGNSCFKGRNAFNALIDNPFMASGARSIGVLDFDGTNSECWYNTILDPINSQNVPLGTVTGISRGSAYSTQTTAAFTPVIVGTTTPGTGTYTTQTGQYTKIAPNVIAFEFLVIWTAHTGTGNMSVQGLSLAGWSTAPGAIPCVLGGFTIQAASYLQPTDTSTFGIRQVNSAGAVSLVTMANAGRVSCSGIVILA